MKSHRSQKLWKVVTIAVFSVLAMSACSNSNTNKLTRIDVTPAAPSIVAGATQQFTATATFGNGTHSDITSQVTWTSGTPAVATISAAGLATGVTAGSSMITATQGTISGNATLTVTPSGVTLQSITVAPAAPTVAVGTAVDFVATGHFSDGSTQVLPGATWSSGTPATASILSPGGIAVALAAGTSSIVASSGAVSSPGNTLTVQAAVARAAYVTGASDGNVSTYILKTGTATLIPTGSLHLINAPGQVVPEPTGRFAFALQANSITTLAVDPVTGALSGSATSPVLSTSVNSDQGVVDPTGRFLYVASNVSSTTSLAAYSISSVDGSLTQISNTVLGSNLTAVILDRTGHFLYAVDFSGNVVFAFSVDSLTGALTALATPSYPTGSGPQFPAIDPSNTHLYVPNSDSTITAYTVNADGSLTAVTGSPFGAANGVGNGPTALAIDATGKFLYMTNANDDTVSGSNIGTGGVLGTSLGAFSVGKTGSLPIGIAIDPGGTTVTAANIVGNTVSSFKLNADGSLTPAPLPQVEAAANPLFINYGFGLTTPSVLPGTVYAVNSVSGDISAFTSTAGTGVLTAAASSPIAGTAGNSFAAADAQGKLLFTGSVAGTSIAGYSTNQSTGGLAALTGSPISVTGTDLASDVRLAPTAASAYVLDVTTGAVVQSAVDPAAGTLTGPGNSSAGFAGANNLAMDPQGDFVYALGTNGTNAILPFTTYIPGGTLAASSQPTPIPGNWTSGAVDGSGQYLVAVDSTSKLLVSFVIALAVNGATPDGSLTAVGASGSVAVTGTGPWVVTFDPQDRVVYVADQGAGTITPYPFTVATGALGAAGTSVNVSANGLTKIATDVTGSFLYAGVKAAAVPGSKGAVAVYSIGAGGALTAVAGSPFTTGTGDAGVAATNVVQ
jgi:6-phosphogluconolactonase (cycloisomerase 2 family)